ncbi:MAG: hypothetical protein OEL81_03090 [Nitrosopumilus sp.]|nr:hypothetical protein [Nitrosopumilus sp.]
MSGKNENEDIKKRLDTMIGIMLNPSMQQGTTKEKIQYLSSLKYDNQEIAQILGTTYSLVAKEKSRAKKVKSNE